MKMILRRKHSDSKLFQFCDVLQEPFVENRGEQKCVFFFENWMKKSKKVAHKKRERTRQQASELKEMQKFLLIKVEHFFNIKMF